MPPRINNGPDFGERMFDRLLNWMDDGSTSDQSPKSRRRDASLPVAGCGQCSNRAPLHDQPAFSIAQRPVRSARGSRDHPTGGGMPRMLARGSTDEQQPRRQPTACRPFLCRATATIRQRGQCPKCPRRFQLISSNLAGIPGRVSGARWMQGGTGLPGHTMAMRQRLPKPKEKGWAPGSGA